MLLAYNRFCSLRFCWSLLRTNIWLAWFQIWAHLRNPGSASASYTRKEALSRDEKRHLWEWQMGIFWRKRGTHRILIEAFITGEKGQLWKRDRSVLKKKKRHVSIIRGKRGTDQILIGAFMRRGKWLVSKRKRGIYWNKRGTYQTWKGIIMKRKISIH